MALSKDVIAGLYRRRADWYDLSANACYLIGLRESAYRRKTVAALHLSPGHTVVEIGWGTGLNFDLLQQRIGPRGQIVGVDLTPEMLSKAGERAARRGWSNVRLVQSDAASFEFPRPVDGVISNGAINLIPDKAAALSEIERVLKPGGRLMLADQIAVGKVARDLQARLASWFQWEGGALPGKDFLAMLEHAGFKKVELAGETGFNSTPKTKGVLIRAAKPTDWIPMPGGDISPPHENGRYALTVPIQRW